MFWNLARYLLYAYIVLHINALLPTYFNTVEFKYTFLRQRIFVSALSSLSPTSAAAAGLFTIYYFCILYLSPMFGYDYYFMS